MLEAIRGVPAAWVRCELWFGVMAPAGTLPAIVARMARDLEAFAGTAEARAKLATQGSVPDFTGPEPFAARIRAEPATWRDIARSAGTKRE